MVAIKIIKKSGGSCKPFDPSESQSVSFLNKYLIVKFISIRDEKKIIKRKFAEQKCENGWLIHRTNLYMYIIYDEQTIEDFNHRFESSLFNNTKFGLACIVI